MAEGPLAPPDLAPAVCDDPTPQQRLAIWLSLLDCGYKLLLAGLRREVGPEGDVRAAYRAWYADQMVEHDRTIVRMLQRMNRGCHAP